MGKTGLRWLKIRFFLSFSILKFILLALCLHKSHTWGNSGSWVVSQNVLSQEDCKILKKVDKSTWFLAWWYRFKNHKGELVGELFSWFSWFLVGHGYKSSQPIRFQGDFFRTEVHLRKVKGDLKNFSWVWLKMLLANHIAEFLNQLISGKNNWINMIYGIQEIW